MEEKRKPQALDDEKLDKIVGGVYNPADYVWSCGHCHAQWTSEQSNKGTECPWCGGGLTYIG